MGIVSSTLAFTGLLAIRETPMPKFNDNLSAFVRLGIPGSISGIIAIVLINFAWNQGSVVGWTVSYIRLANYWIIKFGVVCIYRASSHLSIASTLGFLWRACLGIGLHFGWMIKFRNCRILFLSIHAGGSP
ncbi:hypothetical protein V1509DRAFT_635480 [Lipomyces kononenkoae]